MMPQSTNEPFVSDIEIFGEEGSNELFFIPRIYIFSVTASVAASAMATPSILFLLLPLLLSFSSS